MSETPESDEIRRLLQSHLTTVYRFAMQLLADHHQAQDVAQDTMLRAWKKRRQLRDRASAKAWLLRITANRCRDLFRRQRHAVSRAAPMDHEYAEQAEGPHGQAETSEQVARIQAAMDSLPQEQRTVIYLKSVEGLSIAEIAEVTGDRHGTIKVRLSRARAKLREVLRGKGILEGEQR